MRIRKIAFPSFQKGVSLAATPSSQEMVSGSMKTRLSERGGYRPEAVTLAVTWDCHAISQSEAPSRTCSISAF